MAKKMKRFLAIALALTLCLVQMAVPAMAAGPGGWGGGWYPGWNPGGNQNSDQYEWYQVYVQGNLVAEGAGGAGNIYYLGTHYEAGASVSGATLTWYIHPHGGSDGNFGGTVDLTQYITIPAGYTVNDIEVEESSITGVNDPTVNQYDNAVISITIKNMKDEQGEVVPFSAVTVNHNYYTKDLYLDGDAVLDGSTSSSTEVLEGSSFTATPVTTYNGNEYSVGSVSPDLTITVSAEGNTININYLRTIDTTPEPVETNVTVNHNYFVYDAYTKQTTPEGSTSDSYDAIENETFTATPVTTYGGNEYEMTTDASALGITVKADAAQNVININYIRNIDTTPKATSVTVYHYYRTWDKHTDETVDDGNYVESFNATEFDTFTASPITTYGGNEYEQFTNNALLTINVVADPAENEVIISYLRTVDTSPKATTVTVIHNYFTKDIYTGDTTADGSNTIVSNATEKDSFTATTIEQYEGNDYNVITDEGDLTITVKANDKKNVIEIDYLRTIDTTPNDYEPVVTIVKSADKVSYKIGETITWTITVTNESDFTAYDLLIVDELLDKSWAIDSLAPGASKNFTASAKADQAGALKNVAIVNWTDNDDLDDADEDEITTASDDVTVVVEEPAPAPQPEPTPQPEPEPEAEPAPAPAPQPEPEAEPAPAPAPAAAPAAGAMIIDIIDEDVPLADVPKTGDATMLWVIISMISGGGAILLNRKED